MITSARRAGARDIGDQPVHRVVNAQRSRRRRWNSHGALHRRREAVGRCPAGSRDAAHGANAAMSPPITPARPRARARLELDALGQALLFRRKKMRMVLVVGWSNSMLIEQSDRTD
jgi:hypothetical protein